MNGNKSELQQKALYKNPKTQLNLNTPLTEPAGINSKNSEFLKKVINQIKNGTIDLFNPSSLFNYKVYDHLSHEIKGKADFEVVTLLSSIREINDLDKAGFRDTYQMQNLLEMVRLGKERVEEVKGDIFII